MARLRRSTRPSPIDVGGPHGIVARLSYVRAGRGGALVWGGTTGVRCQVAHSRAAVCSGMPPAAEARAQESDGAGVLATTLTGRPPPPPTHGSPLSKGATSG